MLISACTAAHPRGCLRAPTPTRSFCALPLPQAIGLLDDLDKELNTYAMRVREWYGWHFPEMTKIVADNIAYAKTGEPAGLVTTVCALPMKCCVSVEGCLAGVACTQHYPLHPPRPLPHQPHLSCAVKLMGTRDKAADIDFSDFLEEEAESQLKEAGECAGQRCWVGA